MLALQIELSVSEGVLPNVKELRCKELKVFPHVFI